MPLSITSPDLTQSLVRIRGLAKHFTLGQSILSRGHVLRAVDGFDLDIAPGETVALVGESGCGKTTAGRMIVGLTTPTAGRIELRGEDIQTFRRSDRQRLTRHVQMIFQDPAGSLNPRLRIADSIAEPLRSHHWGTEKEIRSEVGRLLERVGLDPTVARRFPHEFSGGQRQRIGIARAIALKPALIVADEPTSALDVSIRVQILNLLADIQSETGTSFLFISHDLAVVKHFSQFIAVMYAGRIVEKGPTRALLQRPSHPYTQRLLASVPSLDPSVKRILSEGTSAPVDGSSHRLEMGCSFAPRCPIAIDRCRSVSPYLLPVLDAPICEAACHRVETIATTPSDGI